MIPNLFTSSVIGGMLLVLLGLPFVLNRAVWEGRVKGFLRSQRAAWVTLGLGGAWFLWKITQLGQSDFGDYKEILFVLFGITWLGSFFWVKDFLSVRGSAVLALLLANVGLKSAYALYDIPSRLYFVTLLYVVIVLALYFGTVPFKLRDFFNWLYAKANGPKALGGILILLGIGLFGVAFSY